MNRPLLLGLLVTTVAAGLTLVWALGSEDGRVRPALAGPCAADPVLVFEDEPEDPLTFLHLYGTDDKTYADDFRVETVPEVLPPGKPPVTIEIVELDGDPGIQFDLDPASSDGSFSTTLTVHISDDVEPGVYDYVIEMECHEQVTTIPFTIFVDTCPVFFSGFSPSGNGTSPPPPFPSTCTAPSPSPGSPTPTGSATPTATPGPPTQEPRKQGDVNCDEEVTAVDALQVLRVVAGLDPNQFQPCPTIGGPPGQLISGGTAVPPFGDVDCDDDVDSVDALKVLRFVAALGYVQDEPCTDIGLPL